MKELSGYNISEKEFKNLSKLAENIYNVAVEYKKNIVFVVLKNQNVCIYEKNFLQKIGTKGN